MGHQPCSVCSREMNGFHSGKISSTSSALEPKFCSRYCRLYDEQGLKMINGAEVQGNSQYSGFNYWPKISCNCDMCGKEFKIGANAEHNNQVFCSKKCHNAVKTSKRRAMREYLVLRILRTLGWHNGKEHDGWMVGIEIAKKMNRWGYKANGTTAGQILRKWVSRGVVEQQPNSTSGSNYRLAPKHRESPIGNLVWQYNQPFVQKTFNKV